MKTCKYCGDDEDRTTDSDYGLCDECAKELELV
jgi:hypothetical protein